MSAPVDNLVRLNMSPIELRAAADGGDGNTMHGHFAVFDQWTQINSAFEGHFMERVSRGAFRDAFKNKRDQIRVLFDHGADPSIGNKPLGTITALREDDIGAAYEVQLFDTSYVNDLRPALRAGQLGASFRFRVTGENWVDPQRATDTNPDRLPERTITGVELFEFGPVTFPAYAASTAGLRSGTDQFCDRLLNDPRFVAALAERTNGRFVSALQARAAAIGHAENRDIVVVMGGTAEDDSAEEDSCCCLNCGAMNEADAKFCDQCGAAMPAMATTPAATDTTTNAAPRSAAIGHVGRRHNVVSVRTSLLPFKELA